MLDDLTDAHPAVGVDRRAGTKELGGDSLDSCDDARQAFEAWAKQLSTKL